MDANLILLGLVIFLYKIKYVNFAQFYIARIYLVFKDIIWLLIIFFVTEITFLYSYKIIYSIPAN